jgi:hypothetical protein
MADSNGSGTLVSSNSVLPGKRLVLRIDTTCRLRIIDRVSGTSVEFTAIAGTETVITAGSSDVDFDILDAQDYGVALVKSGDAKSSGGESAD